MRQPTWHICAARAAPAVGGGGVQAATSKHPTSNRARPQPTGGWRSRNSSDGEKRKNSCAGSPDIRRGARQVEQFRQMIRCLGKGRLRWRTLRVLGRPLSRTDYGTQERDTILTPAPAARPAPRCKQSYKFAHETRLRTGEFNCKPKRRSGSVCMIYSVLGGLIPHTSYY